MAVADDVQGLLIHGAGESYVQSWHLFYEFPNASAGLRWLRWLETQFTSATALESSTKPQFLTFFGLTYNGLRALGLEAELKKNNAGFVMGDRSVVENPFPLEFIEFPKAAALGDTAASDHPDQWWNGRFKAKQVHGSVHLYCQSDADAAARLAAVRVKFQELGIVELNAHGPGKPPLEGRPLANRHQVHFGYIDGIAQPTVDWENDPPRAGMMDRRQFLLGYKTSSTGEPVSAPSYGDTEDYFRNSTYLAFRWLEQDSAAFDKFLNDQSEKLRPHFPQAADLRELLAAKLVGRWRNGVSLQAAPINMKSGQAPDDGFGYHGGDKEGLLVPPSSHIRSSNPRNQELKASASDSLNPPAVVPRLIRRGMPFGPEWVKGVNDNTERGFLGMFFCVSLFYQFQMILKWMNTSDFSPLFGAPMPLSQDPLFGNRGPSPKRPPFRIPTASGVLEIEMPDQAFVRSRGTAYLLVPSLSTLRRMINPS